MNANIYKHEFRTRLQSALIWSFAVAALILIFSSFFTLFADQAALMNTMLAKFPPEMKAAFGMEKME